MSGGGQIRNIDMPHARSYVCVRAAGPVEVDGDIDKPVWRSVPWTDDFADILGPQKPRPRFRTRAKMMWDADFLYVAAELQEPHVWGTLTEKNAIIFHDNDFEVFIDPDGDHHNYYEFEMNALNTIWELTLVKPYRAGGPAVLGTNLTGLKSAVRIDGTLNDPTDTDRRWCVEIAFPFAALAPYTGAAQSCPPVDGDVWRLTLSRVEWLVDIIDGAYVKVPGRREDNWLWTPQPAVDAHRPWTWGYVTFAAGDAQGARPFSDPAWQAKMLLMDIYDAQRQTNLPADALQDLGLSTDGVAGVDNVVIERTASGWQATTRVQLPDGTTQTWRTCETSRLWQP